jgi:hypothetical protein
MDSGMKNEQTFPIVNKNNLGLDKLNSIKIKIQLNF